MVCGCLFVVVVLASTSICGVALLAGGWFGVLLLSFGSLVGWVCVAVIWLACYECLRVLRIWWVAG